MTVDALERRLQELELESPDAGRVTARVVARLAPPRRRVSRLVTAPLASVLLVLLVAYFAPAADLAIAERTHWGAEVLQWAGLVGASDRITALNASATSSGYRLDLLGAYADSSRTVLIMRANPTISGADGYSTNLTDQFGRSYRFASSISNLQTGDIVLEFEPMAWPDSITGARITLHVHQLSSTEHSNVTGTWELTAALGVDAARSLPAPQPGDLGPAHFRFTAASYTPATVEIDVDVTGVSSQDLNRVVPDGLKGQPALLIELIDPSGPIPGGTRESSGDQNGEHIRIMAYRAAGAGNYILRVSYYGYGSFDRVIKIP
jgi:hypothetical protein